LSKRTASFSYQKKEAESNAYKLSQKNTKIKKLVVDKILMDIHEFSFFVNKNF